MGRKRKMKDPFDLRRAPQSMTLAFNKMRGEMAENNFEMSQRLQGHEVRKIHKGGDFVVQKRDLFGRKRGKPKTYEIKSGPYSKLSEAQKKKKRRLGKGIKLLDIRILYGFWILADHSRRFFMRFNSLLFS